MAKTAINEIFDEKAIKAQVDKVNSLLNTTITIVEKNANAAKLLNAEFGNTKGLKEVTDAFVKLNKVENDNAIAAERVTREQLKTAQMQEKAAASTKREADEWKKLNEQYSIAAREAKNIGIQYGTTSKQFDEASKKAKELKDKIRELNEATGVHTDSVGKYQKIWETLKTAFIPVAAIIGTVVGSLGMAKTIMESTGATAGKFKVFMGGLTNVFDDFKRSIATGNLSGFLTDLTKSWQEGTRFAETLREISRLTRSVSITNAELNIEFQRQRVIERNMGYTREQRIAAGIKALDIEKQMMTNQIDLDNTVYENQLKHVQSKTKLSKSQIDNYVKEYQQNREFIQQAKEYNALVAERNGLLSIIKNRSTITPEGTSDYGAIEQISLAENKIKELNVQISKTPKEVQKAGRELIGLGVATGEELDKLAESQKKVFDTRAESITKTARIEILLAKLRKGYLTDEVTEQVKSEKDAAKTIESIQDEKLDDESYYNSRGLAAIDAKNAEEKKKDDELADMYFANDEKRFASFEGELDKEKKAKEEADKKAIDDAKAKEEKLKQIREAGINASIELYRGLVDLQNASFEQDLQNIDEKATKDKEAKEKELEAAGNNAALKDEINKKYAAKEKALEKERRKIEIERAKFQKAAAIFGIILDTSKAIVSHLTTPWLIPFDVLTGGIQLAVAAAQPIPKYKTGRKGGKAEIATVSEEGVEGLRLKSGEMFLTPEKESNIFIPEGASIIPHKELIKNVSFENLPSYNNTFNLQLQSLAGEVKGLHKSLYHIADTVKNKQETYINITEKGLYKVLKNGNNITEYINAKYKS